jgi:acetyltransferase-like isoleucine patch superfamily enzyme
MQHYESVRHQLSKGRVTPLKSYMALTVGTIGVPRFLLYESLTSLLGPLPGGVGLLLRQRLFPLLFRKVGRGPLFGRSLTLRHPANMELGNRVTIDDYAALDGRHPEGIVIGDDALLNRNAILRAKTGPIRLGDRTVVGANTLIVSLSGVAIGEDVIIGDRCTITAGAYQIDGITGSMLAHGPLTRGPISIGNDVWIGSGASVVEAVNIGDHVVIGAGAVVTCDLPAGAVAVGVPARVIRMREMPDAPVRG